MAGSTHHSVYLGNVQQDGRMEYISASSPWFYCDPLCQDNQNGFSKVKPPSFFNACKAKGKRHVSFPQAPPHRTSVSRFRQILNALIFGCKCVQSCVLSTTFGEEELGWRTDRLRGRKSTAPIWALPGLGSYAIRWICSNARSLSGDGKLN